MPAKSPGAQDSAVRPWRVCQRRWKFPLIADEPTSALDALTQAEILRLFARLNQELSMAILYISHDLLSIASLCSRVAILDGGEIVEFASVRDIFQHPGHPYTRRLVAAIPSSPLAERPLELAGFD